MKAVGITFNPSGDPLVTALKQKYAEVIDLLNAFREIASPGAARHASIAITQAEDAQMRAVKAVTWRD